MPAVADDNAILAIDLAFAAACKAVKLDVMLSTVSLMAKLSVTALAGGFRVSASDTARFVILRV